MNIECLQRCKRLFTSSTYTHTTPKLIYKMADEGETLFSRFFRLFYPLGGRDENEKTTEVTVFAIHPIFHLLSYSPSKESTCSWCTIIL